MKILFVLDYYAPHVGGAETLFQNLCEGLAREHTGSLEISVVTTRAPNTVAFEIKNGVRIHRVRCGWRAGFVAIGWWKVWRLARTTDLVHTESFVSALPAWIGARLAGKLCTITILEVWQKIWRRFFRPAGMARWLEKWLFSRSFAGYVCISEHTSSQLRALFNRPERKNIQTIYPGISATWISALTSADPHWLKKNYGLEKKRVFLGFGRPGVSKGFEDLVRMWTSIGDAFGQVHLFLLLNHEPLHGWRKIQKLITQYGLEDRITLHPSVVKKTLPNFLMGADAVIIPSLSEGFGFSAVEAAALGKAVIARAAGSLPEVLKSYPGATFFTDQQELFICVQSLVLQKKAPSFPPLRRFLLSETCQKYAKFFRGCSQRF